MGRLANIKLGIIFLSGTSTLAYLTRLIVKEIMDRGQKLECSPWQAHQPCLIFVVRQESTLWVGSKILNLAENS